MHQQSEDLNKLIPDLLSTQAPVQQQTATVFEGFKGMRTIFNDVLTTLKKGDEYFAFATGKEFYTKSFSIFITNYHKKREEKGIKVKLLSHKKIKQKVVSGLKKYKNIDLRFTDEITPTSTLIYNSKLFIFVWTKSPTAILINSKDIVNQYKKHFMDVWKRSSPK